jgi:rhodanese-related sulfurtransferase
MSHPFHADDVDVDPDRAKRLIDAGDVQLVDVREQHEWDAGRIAGARHIELERVAS